MPALELYLSFLNLPITLFSFILTWDNCLVHGKCSSRSFLGYFLTNWIGRSPLSWSVNLNKDSSFRLFGWNLSSVFCTFKHNLFPLSQCDRFNRSLFNCLAKTSKDLFDYIGTCIIFKMVFIFSKVKYKCLDHWYKWQKVIDLELSVVEFQLIFL